MPFSSCDGVSWWLDEHQFALPRVPGWGIQSFDTQSAQTALLILPSISPSLASDTQA